MKRTPGRGKQVSITCSCGCGRKRLVRKADVSRGWGLYYDKGCKKRKEEAIKRHFLKTL